MLSRYVVPMPCRECKNCSHGANFKCCLGLDCDKAMDRYEFRHSRYNGYDIYRSCVAFVQQRLDLIPANDLYDRFMQTKFDFSQT